MIEDPRGGSITDDAFLTIVFLEDGEPQDAEVFDNFNCLQLTGEFCINQDLVLTPFIQELWIPPAAVPVDELVPPPVPSNHQLYDEHEPVDLYEVFVTQDEHQFHPDLPPSTVWAFNGHPMGETYYAHYGEPFLVRYHNDLPEDGDGTGYGKPEITIHLHNAHTASESDGFPGNFFPSGEYWDNHYTMFLAGQDEREALGTLWYHDHRADFTAQNTYKGLTGFTIFYDQYDSGDEEDPSEDAFHLPSGEYDVPLQLADKRFTSTKDHELWMDIFNTDGFIGDQYTVNMRVQPYFEVAQRKYRFRLLNVGPSRFYRLALSNEQSFTLIANDGNLLEHPIELDDIRITVAERMDIVVDFSDAKLGSEIYLLNLEDQINGKRPTGRVLSHREAPKLMKFIVDREADDPSEVRESFREIPPIKNREIARTREFVFDNQNGMWTINDKRFDFNRVDVQVEQGTAEKWILKNTSDDWEHPVHIHVEEHQIVKHNGKKPSPEMAGRKDVTTLGPGDTIEVVLRFRDFLGKYPIHCHNTVHEDHAMMLRWDIVEELDDDGDSDSDSDSDRDSDGGDDGDSDSDGDDDSDGGGGNGNKGGNKGGGKGNGKGNQGNNDDSDDDSDRDGGGGGRDRDEDSDSDRDSD